MRVLPVEQDQRRDRRSMRLCGCRSLWQSTGPRRRQRRRARRARRLPRDAEPAGRTPAQRSAPVPLRAQRRSNAIHVAGLIDAGRRRHGQRVDAPHEPRDAARYSPARRTSSGVHDRPSHPARHQNPCARLAALDDAGQGPPPRHARAPGIPSRDRGRARRPASAATRKEYAAPVARTR